LSCNALVVEQLVNMFGYGEFDSAIMTLTPAAGPVLNSDEFNPKKVKNFPELKSKLCNVNTKKG